MYWSIPTNSTAGMATWQWQEVSPQTVGRRDPMELGFPTVVDKIWWSVGVTKILQIGTYQPRFSNDPFFFLIVTYSLYIQSGFIKITTHDRSHLWNEAGALNVLSHRPLYLQFSKLKMNLFLSLLNQFDGRFVNLSCGPTQLKLQYPEISSTRSDLSSDANYFWWIWMVPGIRGGVVKPVGFVNKKGSYWQAYAIYAWVQCVFMCFWYIVII